MLDRAITFFKSRRSTEQAAILIAGGITLYWLGVQAGGLLATLAAAWP